MFLELPTGALADIIGRKNTIAVGYFFLSSFLIIVGFATNPTQLIIGYILSGIGSALISGADDAIIYDTLKEKNVENKYSIVMSNANLGMEISKIIGIFLGGLLFNIQPGLPYILFGLTHTITTIVSLFYKEPIIDTQKFSLRNYISQISTGIKEITVTNLIKAFSLFYIFIGGIVYFYQYYLGNTFIASQGFSAIEISYIYVVIYLSRTIINFVLARKMKISQSTVFIILYLLIVIGMLPAYFSSNVLTIVLALIISIAGQARKVFLNKYANENISSKNRATALSTLNLGITFMFGIITLVVYFPMKSLGSAFVVSLLGFIVLIIGTPLLVKLKNLTK